MRHRAGLYLDGGISIEKFKKIERSTVVCPITPDGHDYSRPIDTGAQTRRRIHASDEYSQMSTQANTQESKRTREYATEYQRSDPMKGETIDSATEI